VHVRTETLTSVKVSLCSSTMKMEASRTPKNLVTSYKTSQPGRPQSKNNLKLSVY
jgi:hypothetical protein